MKFLSFINLYPLFFILLTSCTSDKEEKQLADLPVHTIIFMDKTQSVNINKAFVAQKYQQVLSNIIEQNIHQKGDKLEVYFIHENTSKAKALLVMCRTEKENTDAMSLTDKEGAQTNFDLMLNREKMMILRQVQSKMAMQNIGVSQRFTDIWGSFGIISKAAESGEEVKVYFLSDMIESMRGSGRRDFHTNPPRNNVEAENWAKTDAQNLKKYSLGNADVKLALPFDPTSSTRENNPTITAYWTTLFQELGALGVEEI